MTDSTSWPVFLAQVVLCLDRTFLIFCLSPRFHPYSVPSPLLSLLVWCCFVFVCWCRRWSTSPAAESRVSPSLTRKPTRQRQRQATRPKQNNGTGTDGGDRMTNKKQHNKNGNNNTPASNKKKQLDEGAPAPVKSQAGS